MYIRFASLAAGSWQLGRKCAVSFLVTLIWLEMSPILAIVQYIQDVLDFKGSLSFSKHFKDEFSLGRVGLSSFLLGCVGGIHFCGMGMCFYFEYSSNSGSLLSPMICWCIYMVAFCSFHFLEFLITAIRQSNNKLSYNSFVLNHSKSYTAAVLFSWLEFWLRQLVLFIYGYDVNMYGFKYPFFLLGLVFVVAGQFIRSLAMWQCGENFNHLIMEKHIENHRLVKNGVYYYLRHPSYFGWFYWSIGTQIILHNPICSLAYFYASWKFFKERIMYEEKTLDQFYKEEYQIYRRRTIIGIPFI